MTKKVDATPRAASIRKIRSKRQFGSVRRSLWAGTAARARASRAAARGRPAPTWPFSRAAAPRTPRRVQRHGTSTSCVSATAKRAPRQRGGSRRSRRRSRSSGGSIGSRHDADPGNRPCGSRTTPFRSSTRARWKNASASSSPCGRSPPRNLLPGALVVRKIVAEPELAGTDRVEYPAGAPLDVGRDQRSAPLTRRTAWATAGSGSSRLKTASTYGGRRNAGCEPLIRLIAQRFPAPFIRTAVCGRPRRSR